MQDEINFFLEEKSPEEEKAMMKDGSNPFFALIGMYDKSEKKQPKEETKKSEKCIPDSWVEKTHIRALASEKAIETNFSLFDIYKKAHGMASYTL